MKAGWIVSTVVLLAGCESSPTQAPLPEDLGLFVLPTLLRHGDDIHVRLFNNTDYALGHNLCLAELEQEQASGDWVRVERFPDGHVCPIGLTALPAGEIVTDQQPVHAFIAIGTYRFRTHVQWPLGGDDAELLGNTFFVLPE